MKPKWVEDKYENVWRFPGPEGSKPLYTADQLREAQVEALREAASRAFCNADRYMLCGMASELEKQG